MTVLYRQDITRCPNCGSEKLVVDDKSAILVCPRCGYVLEENIVMEGPEWRAFTPEQYLERARTGPARSPDLETPGTLLTEISEVAKDARGKRLSRTLVKKLTALQRSLRVSRDRSLLKARAEISKLSAHLGLPHHVMEFALKLYRQALEKGLTRGRCLEALAAACVYASCRVHKVPRSLEEVAEQAGVDKKLVGKFYRLIRLHLKNLLGRVPLHSPIDYVVRLSQKLELSPEVQRRAIEILKKASEAGISAGKTPAGLAAAALYIASLTLNVRRTQREVADVAGVTEVTVRNRYRELLEKLDIVLYV